MHGAGQPALLSAIPDGSAQRGSACDRGPRAVADRREESDLQPVGGFTSVSGATPREPHAPNTDLWPTAFLNGNVVVAIGKVVVDASIPSQAFRTLIQFAGRQFVEPSPADNRFRAVQKSADLQVRSSLCPGQRIPWTAMIPIAQSML